MPPDPIVFDSVAVPDRERKVVAARLRISDQEGSVLVLLQKQLLLCLYPLDLAEVPPGREESYFRYERKIREEKGVFISMFQFDQSPL